MATTSGVSGGAMTSVTTTKPLAMFYNGGVTMFHLPEDSKAEDLMKMATGQGDGDGGRRPAENNGEELLAKPREERPMARRRSLQRFFQKRKERLYVQELIMEAAIVMP